MLSLFGLAWLLVLAINQERQATRYPGSIPVASHSNYSGLPNGFRWDDTYRTTDNFTDVYNWYSITFDLGAEARALGRCLLLEGTNEQYSLLRSISVFVCNTPGGQMIFVSRSTSLK
ncbi:MAG: hypothetical protein ACE5E7_13415 [Anaerolineae bacterium]